MGGEPRLPRLPPKESGPKRQHSHYHGSETETLSEPEECNMLPLLTRSQTTELLKQWRKKKVRENEKNKDERDFLPRLRARAQRQEDDGGGRHPPSRQRPSLASSDPVIPVAADGAERTTTIVGTEYS